MTPPLDDATLRELAPLHAAGALEGEERAAFEAALATHPWLREEVASYRAVTDGLATATRLAPDAALRDRVLARIAATPAPTGAALNDDVRDADTSTTDTRRSEAPGRDTPPAPAPLTVVRGDAPARTPVTGTAPARRLALALLGAALAAASLAVVALRREASGLRAMLAASERRAAAVADTLAARERTLDALLGGGRALLVVDLASPRAAAPGVQFLWNTASRTGALRAYGLPRAPEGRRYQLWLIERGRPVPMPVFDADARGRALLTGIPMPATREGIDAIAITVEPAGGSPAPTSAPILVGRVRAAD